MIIRRIVGVIIAYAIFVVSSLALFKLSGQNPHGQVSISFQLLTAAYGVVFSLLSGWILQLIARPGSLGLNYVLALIIAGLATFSLIKAEGSHWTQWMAILIFTPASILGGFYYIRRNNK